jgi:hypothetical protein
MARSLRHSWLVLTGLAIQFLALLIGFVILYTCTSGGIPSRNLSETVFWSTLGLLGFMFFGMAFPLTIFVAMVMLILLICGSNWKRVKFLSALAFVVWGAYWILLAYEICAPPPD